MINLFWNNAFLTSGVFALCLIFFQVSIYIVKKYKDTSIPDIQIFKKAYKRTLSIREKKLVPILAILVAVGGMFFCMGITGQTLPEDPSLHRFIVIFAIVLLLIDFSSASSLLVSAFLLLNDGESVHVLWNKASLLCVIIAASFGILYLILLDFSFLLAFISFLLGGLSHFANSWRFKLSNHK